MLELQDFITRVLMDLLHASFVDYKAVSVEFEDRHEDQPRKTKQEIQSKINGLRVMKIHTE